MTDFRNQKSLKMQAAEGANVKEIGESVLNISESMISVAPDPEKGQGQESFDFLDPARKQSIVPTVDQGFDSQKFKRDMDEVNEQIAQSKLASWEKTPKQEMDSNKMEILNAGFIEIAMFIVWLFYFVRAASGPDLAAFKVKQKDAWDFIITNFVFLFFQFMYNLIGGGFISLNNQKCIQTFRRVLIGLAMIGFTIWGPVMLWDKKYVGGLTDAERKTHVNAIFLLEVMVWSRFIFLIPLLIGCFYVALCCFCICCGCLIGSSTYREKNNSQIQNLPGFIQKIIADQQAKKEDKDKETEMVHQ